jgi:hypothetical protein
MKKVLALMIAVVFLVAAGVSFGTTIQDDMKFEGKTNLAGDIEIGGTAMDDSAKSFLTSNSLTGPTISSPKTTYGFTAYTYTAGSGATYSVTDSAESPGVYKISGGSGTTTFVMSYTGTAAGAKGKVFYIINSSSNTVTFKQSGGTGVNVATKKIVTVVGNGTDFERITADQ